MEATSKQASMLTVCYAQKDEALKEECVEYLAVLREIGLIAGWHERQVQQGGDWSHTLDPQVLQVDLFLILISPRLLSSGYCTGAEMREACARGGQLCVIPVRLYHVDVSGFPLEALQGLPADNRPVSSWADRSEAWWNIDQNIRIVLAHMRRS